MADEQAAALIAILALDQPNIRDGNYRDAEDFLYDLDEEDQREKVSALKPITLFLDYDNVLHRCDSYVTPSGIVGAPGAVLFEYAELLASLLQPFATEIVISSDWVSVVGFKAARDALPSAWLRERVVGTSQFRDCDVNAFRKLPRGVQVQRYVKAHRLIRWLAIDDRADGFENCRDKLIRCQESVGLGDVDVQQLLSVRLSKLSE
jgi:hypothetical protein